MPITLHTDTATDALPEQEELAAGRERDAFQLQVDRDVAALKAATAKAGWPKPNSKVLYHRYVVGADDRASLKTVIRRAMTLHKVEGIWYKEVKTEAGHLVVKFHVARKPLMKDGEQVVKDGKPQYVADDTLNADGSPKK